VEAAELGRKVLNVLQQPFVLQDLPFNIEASVGGALFPEDATDVDSLLQRADVAMYLAKEHGTGYEPYSADHDRYSPRRLGLLGELRRATAQPTGGNGFGSGNGSTNGNGRAQRELILWDDVDSGSAATTAIAACRW